MKKKTWIIVGGASLALALGGTGVAVAATAGDDDALTGSSLEKASDAAIAETGGGSVVSAETSDDADHAYELEVRAPDGTETDVELGANYEVVHTETDLEDDGKNDDNDSDDAPISAAERSSVEAAAVAAAGGGTVVDLERSDDTGIAWEIEVRAADGTETDVELDANLGVVTSQVDTDTDDNDNDNDSGDNDGEDNDSDSDTDD